MKNKYLNKFFCITMLSAMVLAVPTGVKAAEEAIMIVAEEGVSGDGSEISEPEPEVPTEPVPTAAPEPEITLHLTRNQLQRRSQPQHRTCADGNTGANCNTCADGNTGADSDTCTNGNTCTDGNTGQG